MKMAAVVLMVVGVGIVIWGAFGFKTREKVLDVGPIHASRDQTHNVPLPLRKVGVVLPIFCVLIPGKIQQVSSVGHWANLSLVEKMRRDFGLEIPLLEDDDT